MASPTTRAHARSNVAALPKIGQGSLTEQTTQALLEAILDRGFPNDRLPNEPDLASQMGVSRTTIRAALHTLDRLGVITRAPGRGTQLRPHIGRDSMMLHRLIGFQGMLEALYDDVRLEQSFEIKPSASDAARKALGLGPDTPTVVNDKIYYASGRPAVHLLQEVPHEYVDNDLVNALVRGRRIKAAPTIFEFSQFWPGREIDHSVVELVPSIVPKHDFPLDMKPGAPYLSLNETHYNENNEPVAYAHEVVNDELVRMRLVRTR